MIRLKNRSNEERTHFDEATQKMVVGSTIDIALTEHPITRPDEWVEVPKDKTGRNSDPRWERHLSQHKDKQSKSFRIVIKPGETVELENEEQAEYLYKIYGALEGTQEEPKVWNWLLEVDENGAEIKGPHSLHSKYRENKKAY